MAVPVLIGAGGSILQGLFGAAAERKKREKEQAQRQRELATRAEIGASKSMSEGQQAALQRLIEGFGKALK